MGKVVNIRDDRGITAMLRDHVELWTEDYIKMLGDVSDAYKPLLRTAFRSGCFKAITEFAKFEVQALIDKHMAKKP